MNANPQSMTQKMDEEKRLKEFRWEHAQTVSNEMK